MDGSATKRILLLGKTGVGKSSLANTIFGETIFQIKHLNDPKGHCTQAETKSVNGRSLTLIDTPGFFDVGRSEEEIRPEMVRCTTECAPGPHAFLIVLKVEKFTEYEQAVITKMLEYFSEDALKYAVVVFTHGDQLPEGMKIKEYTGQSESLSDLLRRCGGRCHVVDNKYWKTAEDGDSRNNQFQVADLVNTIDKLVTENNGGYYTNEKLHKVEKAIKEEEERIKKSSGNLSEEEIRKQAKTRVFKIMTEKSRPWTKGLVVFAVITGVVAAAVAAWLNYKVERGVTEATLVEEIIEAPITTVVEVISEDIPEVPPSAEDLISPVEEIPGVIQDIWEKCKALYEKIYDPWNPFE